MRIFLAPRSNETSYQNLLSTIENGVDYSRVEPHLNQDGKNLLKDSRKLFVWGNKETKKSSWEKMDPGDLILFYKGRESDEAEGKFVFAGRLLFKQHSKDLGLALWPPKAGDEPWTCIFFLRDLQPIYIPVADITRFAGYSENFVVQGLMPLDEQGTAKILEKFGSVEDFLKQYSLDEGKRERDSETTDVTKSGLELDPRIQESLRAALDAITRRGELLSTERLQEAYTAFRSRFGPDRLKGLDGEALLNTMFLHGNRESLVYWLEFKNDDEFPATRLGSIAGGSAHKFGIFKRKETGQWVTGSPQHEQHITEAQAVEVARKYREQLLAGVELLERLPINADDAQYEHLQDELGRVAPDISGLAWAHKYFSLLFPEKLDDYHNHRYQRFNLVKVLQLPPKQEGLYACAGRFVRFAKLLGWPMNHFSSALNERNGKPKHYWRIGTRAENENIWENMKQGGYIAIGWQALGDLSNVASINDSKEAIRELLDKHYPGDARNIGRKAVEIRDFLTEIAEDELVLAADGERIVGLGRVMGPYSFESSQPTHAPHRRLVHWVYTQQWKLPISEGLQTTVWRLKKDEQNLLEIERRFLEAGKSPPIQPISPPQMRSQRLEGVSGKLQSILERKGQAILYGPPGTGKTYWARKCAFDLASIHTFGRLFSELSSDQRLEVEGSNTNPGLVRFCTFHPAYGYEDFLEGFRPTSSQAGNLIFERRDGLFKRICADGEQERARRFYLVIDEINRGDIPRIFGELLTLLELDKRGQTVNLPLSGESFAVAPNVYVIGTMNTADRSIALLDTALRRRFGFVELMPQTDLFGSASIGGSIPLGPWLNALNDRIREHLGRDSRNLQIGHAYFLDNGKPVTDFSRFVRILTEDIIPLLEEYCYEDFGALTQILGAGLVDTARQRIREELFAVARREELVQALLAPAPEIGTSTDAVASQPRPDEPEEVDTENGDK